jgi:hypothetical protein
MPGATSTATTVHRLDCYEYSCKESILIVVVERGSLLKSGDGVYGFSTNSLFGAALTYNVVHVFSHQDQISRSFVLFRTPY